MGYFAEATDNEVNLDLNTQIEIVIKSLSKDFACFQQERALQGELQRVEGLPSN
ncbi:hypothetical protein J1N35_025653 [Gossypium stocksii]|uniref:Uncharacterized protein n=1 Tax=Gossypium stocksii TaxID=47602 RepID=A0A9D3V7E9_9ROSI|nr:hypothetical protein J1N35_025653 [Gossypium stocksii]